MVDIKNMVDIKIDNRGKKWTEDEDKKIGGRI